MEVDTPFVEGYVPEEWIGGQEGCAGFGCRDFQRCRAKITRQVIETMPSPASALKFLMPWIIAILATVKYLANIRISRIIFFPWKAPGSRHLSSWSASWLPESRARWKAFQDLPRRRNCMGLMGGVRCPANREILRR